MNEIMSILTGNAVDFCQSFSFVRCCQRLSHLHELVILWTLASSINVWYLPFTIGMLVVQITLTIAEAKVVQFARSKTFIFTIGHKICLTGALSTCLVAVALWNPKLALSINQTVEAEQSGCRLFGWFGWRFV